MPTPYKSRYRNVGLFVLGGIQSKFASFSGRKQCPRSVFVGGSYENPDGA